MSKKLAAILLFLGFSFMGFSQMVGLLQFVNDTLLPNYTPSIQFNNQALYNTSMVSSKFVNQLLTGKYIDLETRLNAFESVKTYNYLWADANTEVRYSNALENNWNYAIHAKLSTKAFGVVAGDLIGFSYFGNSAFLGSNLEFSNTNATAISYTAIGAGVGQTYIKSRWNAGLDFLILSDYNQLELTNSRLSTNIYGTQLYTELHAKWHRNVNGLVGVAFSGQYEFSGGPQGNAHRLSIGIENLGLAFGSTQTIAIDTAFLFTGLNAFDLPDLQVFGDSLQDDFSQSIDTVESSKTIVLPAQLTLNYTKQFSEKLNINLAIAANYLNEIVIGGEVGASYLVAPKQQLGLGYFIGASGANNLNVYYSFMGEKWQIGAFAQSVESLVLPAHSSGLGAGVLLRRNL